MAGQPDSQQGITTRLAGETGHWCSYILWHVELKTASIDAIGCIFVMETSCIFMAVHCTYPPSLKKYLWYWLASKYNYLKLRAFQLVTIEESIHWMVLDDCILLEKCIQATPCILEMYNELNI